MAYADRPTAGNAATGAALPAVDYHDRVRWGPILAGLFTAIASQLVLSAIGAAIGLTSLSGSGAPRSNAGGVGSAVGLWAIISLLISLFIGGWITTRTCGPMSKSSALLNGAILWATTLAISAWLLSSGVSGAFGLVASNAGAALNQAQQNGVNLPQNVPNVTADQTRDIAGNAAKVGWSFALGSLLALGASQFGGKCRCPSSSRQCGTNNCQTLMNSTAWIEVSKSSSQISQSVLSAVNVFGCVGIMTPPSFRKPESLPHANWQYSAFKLKFYNKLERSVESSIFREPDFPRLCLSRSIAGISLQ